MPAEVVTEAHRSHEVIVEVEHHRRSALYCGAHNADRMYQADLPLVDVAVSVRFFAAAAPAGGPA